MIIFDQVSKFALNQVNIHIPKGLTVGLIGKSGSGKSTFIRLCCGNLEAERGCVYVGNEKVQTNGKNLSKSYGVIMNNSTNLQREMSIKDNFIFFQYIYQMQKDDYYSRYKQLSRELGFKDYQNEKIGELSLGQRRRVELAATFFHHPDIVLLDEPTIGLDLNGKKILWDLIKQREKDGLTTIVASQEISEIDNCCSRICVLQEGQIGFYGSKAMLQKKINPIETMQLVIQGPLPDLEDLPVQKYSIENQILRLTYNSNIVCSTEILRAILPKLSIREMSIRKASITDVMVRGEN